MIRDQVVNLLSIVINQAEQSLSNAVLNHETITAVTWHDLVGTIFLFG